MNKPLVSPANPFPLRQTKDEITGTPREQPNQRHLCRTTAYPRYCVKHDHVYYPCLCGCRPDDCPQCLTDEWKQAFTCDDFYFSEVRDV